MTFDQGMILAILAGTMACLIWDRWRYDLVALTSLLLCVLLKLIPAGRAFSGFSDPAVITVATVLMMSAAVGRSGIIDLIAGKLVAFGDKPRIHLAGFCALALFLSAFMNNVAALVLIMPVALSKARRFRYPAGFVLMPISFATLLGGMVTLIGTPANLLVSGFRSQLTGKPFAIFDFAPVGIAVAGLGLLYLIAARRAPQEEEEDEPQNDDVFDVADYVTEARVKAGSQLDRRMVKEIEARWPVTIVGVVRNDRRLFGRIAGREIAADDILLLQAETRALEALIGEGNLELVERESSAAPPPVGDMHVMEAVITPNSMILGSTPSSLDLRQRYGVTLLAAARQGRRFEGRLRDANLSVGDVILLEGSPARIRQTIKTLGCLPLAERLLKFSPRRTMLPVAIFAGAVVLAATGLVPMQIAFALGALLMVLTGLMTPREAFQSVNWSVIVLLAAMIPIGFALETTGAAGFIAHTLLEGSRQAGPMVLLGATLLATMAITPFLNNATTAILMAPIVGRIALDYGASPDPFLMAVVIGASADFLTPFGHHNNTLILGPGGYRFTDYLRYGLPLSALTFVVALLAIPVIWPFRG